MVHGSHRPEALTLVFHHIVPREWQSEWAPGVGKPQWGDRHKLWAPDCIQVCPTGHANIHYHIRGIQDHLRVVALHTSMEYSVEVVKSYYPQTREAKVAKQAFLNWATSGGSWDVIVPRGRS
jgi:hypothetical protein